jgi:hypothetical protein
MKYRLFTLSLLVFLGLFGALPLITSTDTTAQAEDGQRCFPETGECIAGPILDYWEANGGLPVFGYPITPLRIETIDGWTGPTQWFERDRLEDHGTRGVLAGRLGVELLALQGQPWETFPQATRAPGGCIFFTETRHTVCEPFLSHWSVNGGLERFGYPITEPFQATIGAWTGTVQYFERRRMELHIELPGLPILLGHLGTEVLNYSAAPIAGAPGTPGEAPPPAGPTPACVDTLLPRTSPNSAILRSAYEQVPFRSVLGCPIAYAASTPAALQRMERGQMLWIDLGSRIASPVPPTMARRFIFTITPGPRYNRYEDTWVAGVDPMTYDIRPPHDGLYVPWGGFGKLWVYDSNVRNALGWAVQQRAQEGSADVVIFDNIYNDPANLGTMVLFHETGTVYTFGRLDKPDEVNVYP